MTKSQKLMVAAFILVFIAQFFEFGSGSFYYDTHGGGMTITHKGSVSQNGWFYHSWVGGVIMGVIAFIFYVYSPKVLWYWIATILCLIFSLGSGMGANIGYLATIIAGYSIYCKNKEAKTNNIQA